MSRKAMKLFEQMQESKASWTRSDLDTLLEGFGFEIRHGRSHDIASHPKFPFLRQTLPRHRHLPRGYVEEAVKLIHRLSKHRKLSEYNLEEGASNEPDDTSS